MAWTTPITFDTTMVIDADTLNTYVSGNIGHLYNNLPTRATMWHIDSRVITGNPIGQGVSTSQRYNMFNRQNLAANGDIFETSCVLAAGTYTLYILGLTGVNGGKINWTLDGVSIATGQDWYSASEVYNVTKTVTDVIIATGGRHTLRGTVSGKNASSGGYEINLTKMWFAQASD